MFNRADIPVQPKPPGWADLQCRLSGLPDLAAWDRLDLLSWISYRNGLGLCVIDGAALVWQQSSLRLWGGADGERWFGLWLGAQQRRFYPGVEYLGRRHRGVEWDFKEGTSPDVGFDWIANFVFRRAGG